MIKKLHIFFSFLGFDPFRFLSNIIGIPGYLNDIFTFKKQRINSREFKFSYYPILFEKKDSLGITSGHYFYQDLHVAQKIYIKNPAKHVDIGSRTDGLIAHIASYREVEVIDIRINSSHVKNVKFIQCDLMILPKNMIEYCDSISSLHAIEHFGLGRYGDPIDYNGHIKAINNIHRMLKKGGLFYFSSPIGEQRVEFNAHRVFSIQYLIEIFKGKFMIDNFSYVNDDGKLIENADFNKENIAKNFNCLLGCGIFELKKI